MNILNISPNKFHNYPSINKPVLHTRQQIAFGGLHDEEQERAIILATGINSDGSDTENMFLEAFRGIANRYKEIKDEIASRTGFAKLGKKKALEKAQHDEGKELDGFLKAQEITIAEQEEKIKLTQANVALLKANNASRERISEMEAMLARQVIIQEKMQRIAEAKNVNNGFDRMGGYEREKFILTTSFIKKLAHEMAGEDVKMPNGILFFGPYGNGKSTFAKAFAESASCLFPKPLRGKGREDDARQKSLMKQLVEAAETSQENFENDQIRTIIQIDEFDEYANENSVILEELKQFMENCAQDYHCTIFATTNHPLRIPSPIRNSTRMPVKVSVDPPNYDNAIAVFRHYLKDMKTQDIDYDELAQEILAVGPKKAYNNSQIEAMCNQCAQEVDGTITQKDLLYCIRTTDPGLTKENLDEYKEAMRILIPNHQQEENE